jgi:hypothetical protein
MPGIACFSKKTEIGDTQISYHAALFPETCHAVSSLEGSMDEKQAKNDHIDQGID